MKRNTRNLFVVSLLLISLLTGSFALAEDEFSLPSDLTVIEASAFENDALQNVKVELPDSLRRIEAKAFAGTGLRTVRLGAGITYIADNAFDGCEDFHPEVYPGTYAADWCAANHIVPWLIKAPAVAVHTADEIRSFVQSHPVDLTSVPQYRQAPTGGDYGGSAYNYGLLTDASLANGINMVNVIRYVTGLNADVVNVPEKEEILAASALINALNQTISHYPARPTALADSRYDDLYAQAQAGAQCSNLSMGTDGNLAEAVLGFMDDSDEYNVEVLGHRRWIINPGMGRTTFGFCHGKYVYSGHTFDMYYSGLYSFDFSGSGNQRMVAWPARQTPVSYFAQNFAWSVSYGTSLDQDSISVTLVREQDGSAWSFSSAAADGFFNVNNDGYGLSGCVIFQPSNLTVSAGDSFLVSIRNSADHTLLEYRVTFFSL